MAAPNPGLHSSTIGPVVVCFLAAFFSSSMASWVTFICVLAMPEAAVAQIPIGRQLHAAI